MLSSAFSVAAVALLPFVAGCSDDDPVEVVDTQAPFPPDGVFSITGDGYVTICWNENLESDLAAYWVYACDPTTQACDTPQGRYDFVAEVPASETCYDDFDVNNGDTWFYAVAAVDESGNDSELSYELVFDTPRPAGTNLELYDFMGQSNSQSGYDFSSVSGAAQAWDDASTDIYFGATDGVNYITAAAGVDIQDFGWTFDMDDLNFAPDKGYSPSGRVEAIEEHGYFVRITGGQGTHYAKFRVTFVTNPNLGVDSRRVTVDWAYQTATDNPELAPGVKGGASK
jgi:hypothetical protein